MKVLRKYRMFWKWFVELDVRMSMDTYEKLVEYCKQKEKVPDWCLEELIVKQLELEAENAIPI